MSAKQRFKFTHNGDEYAGTMSTTSKTCSLTVEQMPHLEFKVSLTNPEDIKLLLPTDKKGRRPSIACSTAEVPVLDDAIQAAFQIAQVKALTTA